MAKNKQGSLDKTVTQFEINWDKITEDVKAAANLINNYPEDNGKLTKDQIRQIKKTAPKTQTKNKKTSLF